MQSPIRRTPRLGNRAEPTNYATSMLAEPEGTRQVTAYRRSFSIITAKL